MGIPFIPNLDEVGGLSAEFNRTTNDLEYELSDVELAVWEARAWAKMAGGAFSAALDAALADGRPSINRVRQFAMAAAVIVADRVDGIEWIPKVYDPDGVTVIAEPNSTCFYVRTANIAWFHIDFRMTLPESYTNTSIKVSMPPGIESSEPDNAADFTGGAAQVLLGDDQALGAAADTEAGARFIRIFKITGTGTFGTGTELKVSTQLMVKVRDI